MRVVPEETIYNKLMSTLGFETEPNLSYRITLSEFYKESTNLGRFDSKESRWCSVCGIMQPIYFRYVQCCGKEVRVDFCKTCDELCDPHKEIEVGPMTYQYFLRKLANGK